MKVVYIAGKYLGTTHAETYDNIQKARKEAEFVWRSGGAALCPHLNSAFMSGIVAEEVFLEGCLAMLRVCDLLYLIPGWEYSAGARTEKEYADSFGIPICKTKLGVTAWLLDK